MRPSTGCGATGPAPKAGSATSNAATGWIGAASKAAKARRSGSVIFAYIFDTLPRPGRAKERLAGVEFGNGSLRHDCEALIRDCSYAQRDAPLRGPSKIVTRPVRQNWGQGCAARPRYAATAPLASSFCGSVRKYSRHRTRDPLPSKSGTTFPTRSIADGSAATESAKVAARWVFLDGTDRVAFWLGLAT